MNITFKKIVDLTQTIRHDMAVYPGDPPVVVEEMCHQATDGFAVARIQLNDHAGTHVETQYHMIPGRRLADEPIERFIGRASVVPAGGPQITVENLRAYEPLIQRNPFTLLHTGYSGRTSAVDPDDPQRPIVSLEALTWLCERGMRLLGIDAFDFDSGPPYPGHHFLFKRDVLVVEGLRDLDSLADEVTLLVLPLPIAGTGASPCRALALVE